MSKYYKIVKGTVSQMKLFKTQTDLLYSRYATRLDDTDAAAIAASQINLDNSKGLINEYFSCQVGNISVEGLFSQAFFLDGDFVEAVGEFNNEGRFFAYAVRRQIDHRLWFHPKATKGTLAAIKTSLRYSHWVALFVLIYAGLLSLIQWSRKDFISSPELVYQTCMVFISMMVILSTLVGVITFFYANKNRKIANKIFATLGYRWPKWVDMDKENRIFLKHIKTNPDYYCDSKTRQFGQFRRAQFWVRRYCHAPKIPDYITVIDGDNNALSKNTELITKSECK